MKSLILSSSLLNWKGKRLPFDPPCFLLELCQRHRTGSLSFLVSCPWKILNSVHDFFSISDEKWNDSKSDTHRIWSLPFNEYTKYSCSLSMWSVCDDVSRSLPVTSHFFLRFSILWIIRVFHSFSKTHLILNTCNERGTKRFHFLFFARKSLMRLLYSSSVCVFLLLTTPRQTWNEG